MGSTSPIRALIFDCGNTLLVPKPTVAELCDMVAAQHGHRLDPEAFERALPHWGQMYYERLRRGMYERDASVRAGWADHYAGAIAKLLRLAPDEAQLVGGAIYDWYAHPERWSPYPDTMETLAEGKQRGFVQGVLSDWGSDLLPILAAHGLTEHLDFVVVSAVVGHAKPGGEIFRQAVQRAGVRPAEALYVGDSYVADVLGARSAGLHAVLLDRDGTAPAVDCPVIRSLDEIFGIAESISGRAPAGVALN
jgi:putative hydrolase of the HAD superfamily